MRIVLILFMLMAYTTAFAQDYDKWNELLKQQWADSVRNVMQESFDSQSLTFDNLTMRLHWQVFGKKPEDGRSLFISLHGGGGAPAALNDSQWRNQWQLYTPKEGVYLCPRPPFNTWDLHFRPESDRFYEDIIHMMVAFLDVNPDKVYLMGYSAGGDGVWRLAPRMADHWAAASMMAGHPGDVSLLNLRNLPFMVWCGENDVAYERNIRCSERIMQLDSLHRADPEGYVYEGHIVAEKGHWMDRADTLAVAWMEQYRRNPYPDRIVWRQEEVTCQHFYYLTCPKEEMERGKEVRLYRKGNRFFIDRCDYSALTIGLDPQQLNLRKPVSVYLHGRRICHAKPKPSFNAMKQSLFTRQDLSFAFPAEIRVDIR